MSEQKVQSTPISSAQISSVNLPTPDMSNLLNHESFVKQMHMFNNVFTQYKLLLEKTSNITTMNLTDMSNLFVVYKNLHTAMKSSFKVFEKDIKSRLDLMNYFVLKKIIETKNTQIAVQDGNTTYRFSSKMSLIGSGSIDKETSERILVEKLVDQGMPLEIAMDFVNSYKDDLAEERRRGKELLPTLVVRKSTSRKTKKLSTNPIPTIL